MPLTLFGHSSVRRRIVFPFVVLVLFVGAVGSAVVSAEFSGTTAKEFDDSLVRSASRTNDRLAQVEADRLQQLRTVANTAGIDSAVRRGDAAAVSRVVLPVVGNAQPERLVVRVLNGAGSVVTNVRRDAAGVSTFFDTVNLASEPAVQHALRGDRDAPGDKYVLVLTEAGVPIVYWVSPIRSQSDGQTVVGAALLGQSLSEIAQSIRGAQSIDIAFYGLDGRILTSSLDGTPALRHDVTGQVTHSTPVRQSVEVSGHPYGLLVSDWTMRGASLGYIAVAIDAASLSSSLAAIRIVLAILFAGTALATIVIGLALADRITRPIDELVASMRTVSAGDYSRRVRVRSDDEIGYLARSFNDMAAALQAQIREREEGYFRNLEALARVIDARDPYTFEHSARVAAISEILAAGMNLPPIDITTLRRSGLLHDVGKIGVPDRILGKTAPLTEEEWAVIRQHPVIGYEMLKDIRFLEPSLDAIRHHHERWDGDGYPDKMSGSQISPFARIVAVADAFDAMTSDRPYRKGFSFVFAARTIASEAGKQFDPAVVEVFKAKQAAIFARLEEMGKQPAPHAADIHYDEAA